MKFLVFFILLFILSCASHKHNEGLQVVSSYDSSFFQKKEFIIRSDTDEINDLHILQHIRLPIKIHHYVRCLERGFEKDTLFYKGDPYSISNMIFHERNTMRALSEGCFSPKKSTVFSFKGKNYILIELSCFFSSSNIGEIMTILIDTQLNSVYYLGYPIPLEYGNGVVSNFKVHDGRLIFLEIRDDKIIGHYNFEKDKITFIQN